MTPAELRKKIRTIEIYTTKAADDVLAGAYESIFKGRGMEFDEVREYAPGDEVRSIDWNVTARMGRPFIKRYVEERELTMILLVDLSASGSFGSTGRSKNEIAAEICALLSFAAIKNNDKIGLVVFTDHIEMAVPPAKGSSHVLRLIRNILQFTPQRTRTDIRAALEYIARVTHKRCVVFLISDFQSSGYEKTLRIVARRHDLIALAITDPREEELPNAGLIELEDAETGRLVLLDSASSAERDEFRRLAETRRQALHELLRRSSIDCVDIVMGKDHVQEIRRFFERRRRRLAA